MIRCKEWMSISQHWKVAGTWIVRESLHPNTFPSSVKRPFIIKAVFFSLQLTYFAHQFLIYVLD